MSSRKNRKAKQSVILSMICSFFQYSAVYYINSSNTGTLHERSDGNGNTEKAGHRLLPRGRQSAWQHEDEGGAVPIRRGGLPAVFLHSQRNYEGAVQMCCDRRGIKAQTVLIKPGGVFPSFLKQIGEDY